MITIIDYGRGNLYSVEKAFSHLGAKTTITRDAEKIAKADKIVLPGVGAFGDCMDNLIRCDLVDVIKTIIKQGKPFLGICLGLQLLFESSEETPGVTGLGIIAGKVQKIKSTGLKIPHMGWNNLKIPGKGSMLKDLPKEPYVYFVHSYHGVPDNTEFIAATIEYGETLTAAIEFENIKAVQFHPEKSSDIGLKILSNFKEM